MANINEEARIPVYLNDEQAKSALKNLQKEADKWRKKMHEAMVGGDMKGMKEAERELKKVNKETAKLKSTAFDTNKVLNNLSTASIKDLRKTIRTLIKEQSGLNRGTKEYIALQKKIDAVKGEFGKINGKISTQGGLIKRLTNSAKGLLPAFGWAAIIGGAVKGAKALFNVYNETAKARREAERLTGLSGKSLADLTAKIQGTAQTFKKDFSGVLVATNNFAKTMGISAEDALAKINDGFLTGADSSGEFMDILKEYGPQFKAAGLSADESIALISQQVKTGIYSDKGVDAIKEATLSLREMTPATKAAIDNIGLSSANIQEQLRNGTISVFDAIRMVSNRMAELPPQSSEVGTALADIFKGAGEDAGLEYITMLGTAELSLEKLKKGAGDNAKAQEKLLEANIKLKQAWSELMGTGTGSFDAIKAFAIDLAANGISKIAKGIAGVRDWFIELYNGSLPIRLGFQYMFAMWQTSLTLVKTAFKGLWEQLKLGGKLIKAVLTFDLSGIKAAFQDYGENMKNTVIENAKKVATNWKDAYENTINGKLKPVKQLVEVETVITTPAKPESDSTNQAGTGAIKTNRVEVPELTERIAPRIAAEETFSKTVLEESKLRQRILDNEQKAADERAAMDEQLQEDRKAAYLSTLDTIISVFGQESKIGKAALMAKQAYAIAETIINIAKGTGKTAASVPFPANIPLIMGFVGQVAALVGTIKSATGKVKGYAAGGFTQGEKMYLAGEKGTEWIAPNWMTKSPQTAPVISNLDRIRQGKNPVVNLDLFSKKNVQIIYDVNSNIPIESKNNNGQNEILSELVARIGNSLDENTKATNELMKWKPKIYSELIKKDFETLEEIEKTSRL